MYVCMYIHTYVCMHVYRAVSKAAGRCQKAVKGGGAGRVDLAVSMGQPICMHAYICIYVCMHVCMHM